uniref:Uncharacterized protein n=1 Tax=Glossina palpalis gambiensis TaxID=67801 RepID=A0A1B0AUN4_9MUSC
MKIKRFFNVNKMHILLMVLAIISLVATVSAIKCYSCESVYEINCGEDFEAELYFKLDCDHIAPPRYLQIDKEFHNATACVKKLYTERGIQKIMRHCFFGNINDTEAGCRTDPSLMSVQELGCYVCDDDNYCNKANNRYDFKNNWQKYFTLIFALILGKFINL